MQLNVIINMQTACMFPASRQSLDFLHYPPPFLISPSFPVSKYISDREYEIKHMLPQNVNASNVGFNSMYRRVSSLFRPLTFINKMNKQKGKRKRETKYILYILQWYCRISSLEGNLTMLYQFICVIRKRPPTTDEPEGIEKEINIA
jgi:hypothetical protein